jgi:hypothetical protein
MAGAFGQDEYGSSPYGSAADSFRVIGALALDPTTVLVQFSLPLNLGFPPILDSANYSIPGLTVVAVQVYNATTIRLITSVQLFGVYTVTVTAALSQSGAILNPLFKTATFTGVPSIPQYLPVGVRKTRLRLVFSEPMLLNVAILDPASYLVTDIQGNVVPVTSVTSEQGASNPRAVVLLLGTDMTAAEWYVTTVGPGIVSAISGLTVVPATQKLQWIEPTLATSIPIAKFSGEVQSGLLTDHAGLVYFSPALDAAVSDSIIQVDSVEVCTKAFDVYAFPVMADPPVLYTFGTSAALAGSLNSQTVLWAAFPRLVEARTNLQVQHVDVGPQAVDGPCTATFTEPWDPSFVSLLNNSAWLLFDNTSMATPPVFICANNLGPIPPGPTTTIILQP